MTFPLYVYGVALRGIPVQVNVLATMLFLVTVVAIVLVIWQQRRAEALAAIPPGGPGTGAAAAGRSAPQPATAE